jgi:polysaccharide biosynthesis protein PslH
LKILIITPRIPYPPFRGDKLKPYNLSRYLSDNNEVTIACFTTNRKEKNDIRKIEKPGIKVYTVKLSVFKSLLNVVLTFFTSKPLQSGWFYSADMRKLIRKLTEEQNFDVVYFHLIRSAQYLQDVQGKPVYKVLDLTDAVSLYLKRFADIEKNPFKKLFIRMEQRRLEKYERIACKFDTVFICSEVDKEYFEKKNISPNIRLLYNGVDTEYFSGNNSRYNPNKIIFTGNMPYYPNQDAVVFFTKSIFPKVLKKQPDAVFYIVGQNPPPAIQKLSSGNIKVTGFVPDIKQEYLDSCVNVAPMRFGAGTVNKVTESISLGVPVVSTSIAIKGLPHQLHKYIFVADDVDSFAEQVIKIMQDNSIRTTLMEEGKEVVRELLSWEYIAKNFENYILNEINNKKAAR